MKSLLSHISMIIAVLLLMNCGEHSHDQNNHISSFVATLGNDTLVVEQFSITAEKVEAEVLIRSPRTSYLKQTMLMDVDGKFLELISSTYDPKAIDGEALSVQTIKIEGDSLVVTQTRDTTVRVRKFEHNPEILPWFDMVHWPYEVATRQMVGSGAAEVDQLMLAGRSPGVFEIRTIEKDSISIKHPYRGTMYARIDAEGGLQYYDATETTRKLIVKRGGAVDMVALATKYADKSIGSLSGAGKTEAAVHGANLVMTFGQPAKRGRELFGGIVPWNERWRTGANRATHFSTDKDLKFGDLDVPAGEYTLFSIPSPEGGTLIINKQTGQNGNSYDESQDLGRVFMTMAQNDESVELFTIDAIERDDQGVLQLKWGETILEILFEVVK